jgi:hypothetical protein
MLLLGAENVPRTIEKHIFLKGLQFYPASAPTGALPA